MSKKDPYPTAVSVRMEEELRDALETLAQRDARPLSNYVRVILERHARQAGALTGEPATAPATANA